MTENKPNPTTVARIRHDYYNTSLSTIPGLAKSYSVDEAVVEAIINMEGEYTRAMPTKRSAVYTYLEELRMGGTTNMWGSPSYVAAVFNDITLAKATEVVGAWMNWKEAGEPAFEDAAVTGD